MLVRRRILSSVGGWVLNSLVMLLPRTVLGGHSRILRWPLDADGYQARHRREIDRVRQAVAGAGRDPKDFEIIVNGATRDGLEALTEAGVDHPVFNHPPLGPEVVIPKLDQIAEDARLA